jgi:hypothetical protein
MPMEALILNSGQDRIRADRQNLHEIKLLEETRLASWDTSLNRY